MVSHKIKVDVIVGKSTAKIINSWTPEINTNDLQINRYGSLWGESEVLYLGSHFNLYSSGGFGAFKKTGGSTTKFIPSKMKVLSHKKPATSVSGNFGEVLTILALETKVAPNPLLVSHLTAVKSGTIKCPDLIVESTPLLSDYSLFTAKCHTAPALPEFIPGECKNNAFVKAIRQLSKYWYEVGSRSPVFGFGLISRIEYKNPPNIKFNLLVPLNKVNLAHLLVKEENIDNLTQADFRGCLFGF
ncbi:hypothetical protein [Pseudalkalibacillus sp. SCS-8]|uniref:hypothetical protein n=1 Tax=Pseudalkalibacillus nanhaiensis TaxID=3115291 RepID=UPI0032D9C33B